MTDLIGHLGKSQHQIIILTSVKLRAKATDLIKQALTYHRKVAGVHLAIQKVGRPIGLEQRIHVYAAQRKMILIGIQYVGMIERNRLCIHKKCNGRKQIVVIQKSDIISRCHFCTSVGIFGNPRILLQTLIADTRIGIGKFFDHALHVGMRLVASVRQTQLPIGVGLCDHRFDHFLKQLFGCIVQRHKNTELNLLLKHRFTLCIKLIFIINGSLDTKLV